LDEEDATLFSKVVALGSGATVTIGAGLEELIELDAYSFTAPKIHATGGLFQAAARLSPSRVSARKKKKKTF
jgi:hypothetical protein